ncbi:hypothetical protein SAMN05518672_10224 [Chitinophaga sp. CF118]|uniref:hypothetical protein n=1 Tax=Chitinophaga sp. CF118 TaxID=1884367 RepID=UPI0008F29824|nr:hypothetical protein [Chitinophaga sp. CF118]SFD45702.1 hypothetical protein SAMN05518672_10224 [Chitinophaga sp. CF118]
MKKKKEYDAVAEVRKIRDELSLRYLENPAQFRLDLKAAAKLFREQSKRVFVQA